MKKFFRLRNLSILVILLVFVYTAVSQEIQLREQKKEIYLLKNENDKLDKECLYYEKKKAEINNESQVTKQMREKLKLIKDGEIRVIDKNQRKNDNKD